jgi:hypothetical protein
MVYAQRSVKPPAIALAGARAEQKPLMLQVGERPEQKPLGRGRRSSKRPCSLVQGESQPRCLAGESAGNRADRQVDAIEVRVRGLAGTSESPTLRGRLPAG